MKNILAGSLLASSLVFGASSVDLNINKDTLEINGNFSLNEAYDLNNNSDYFLTLSFLNSEAKSSPKSEKLVSMGFKMMNPYISDNGFTFGVGINTVWADNNEDNFLAIPINIYGAYQIIEDLHIDTHIAYAPKVLSFAKAKRFASGELRVNYKVIDNGYAYIGARSISTTYEDDTKIKFDNNLFYGFKVQF